MSTAVTVYTAGARCMACKLTLADLDKRGIGYQAIDLHADAAARDYVAGLGYQAAPVVTVDDGTTVCGWSGYRPDSIASIA